MNFRVTSPDRITHNTIIELAAELAEKAETTLAIDRAMSGRVCLRLAEEALASDGVTTYNLPSVALTEYMTIREMYWFLHGLLNGLDVMETLVYNGVNENVRIS